METPKKKHIERPHDGLRLGYCEAKDCKYSTRVIVTEIRLTNGRVFSICESCLDSLSGKIKRYKRELQREKKCDIIKVGEEQ